MVCSCGHSAGRDAFSVWKDEDRGSLQCTMKFCVRDITAPLGAGAQGTHPVLQMRISLFVRAVSDPWIFSYTESEPHVWEGRRLGHVGYDLWKLVSRKKAKGENLTAPGSCGWHGLDRRAWLNRDKLAC